MKQVTHGCAAALLLALAGCGGGGGSSTNGASAGVTPATSVGRTIRLRATESGFVLSDSVRARSRRGGEDASVSANRSSARFSSPLTGTIAGRATGTDSAGGITSRTYERETGEGESLRQDTLGVVDLQYARLGTATSIRAVDVDTTTRTATVDVTSGYFRGSNPANAARPEGTLTGRATYGGSALVSTIGDGPSGLDAADSVTDTTLRADFNRGTIEGEIRAVRTGNQNVGTVDVLLENGVINGNEYEGDVRVVDSRTGANELNTAGGRADLNGGFYGPSAEETAGLVDVQGRAVNGRQIDMIGAYGAEAIVPPRTQP